MLFVGMLSGTYSSICIATPVLADLKEREPQYKELANRVALRAAGGRAAQRKAAKAAAWPAGRQPRSPRMTAATATRTGRGPGTPTSAWPTRRGLDDAARPRAGHRRPARRPGSAGAARAGAPGPVRAAAAPAQQWRQAPLRRARRSGGRR